MELSWNCHFIEKRGKIHHFFMFAYDLVSMKVLSKIQIRQLIRAVEPEFKDMVTLMFSLGLRINEVTKLERGRVDLQNETLTVVGKGNRSRLLPFTYGVDVIMKRALKANRAKYCFEHYYGYPYGNRRLRKAVYDAAARCNLVGVHPHTLRHSRATTLIDDGCSLWHVKQLLGHADIRTTAIYLHYSVEGLRKAIN